MRTSPATATVAEQPPPTPDRLARTLRWARWPVLLMWLVALVILAPLSGVTADDTAQANLPASAASTKVAEIQNDSSSNRTDDVVVVFVDNSGLTANDKTAVDAAQHAVSALVGPSLRLTAPGAPQNADGKAMQFTAHVQTSQADLSSADTAAVKAVRAAVAGPVAQAGDGLQVAVTGAAAITADNGLGNQNALLLTALVIVVVILLLVYRSPLLWVFPLLGTLAALVLAKAVTHGLTNAGVTVTSLSTAILTVLVMGASTDYALLLVHRYREELRVQTTPAEAMAIALRRTLPALAASAATVICAMLCLLAARSSALHGLGPVAAVAIGAVLLAQLTLLPALLLVVGRVGFWPLIPRPGKPGADGSRMWNAVGTRVSKRPALVAAISVVLLGAACFGLAGLRTDNNPISLIKGQAGSVVGEKMVNAHYPAGEIAPLTVLVPPAQAADALKAAQSSPNVQSVQASDPVGGYSTASVILNVPPYESSGYTAIKDLRSRLATAAPGALVGGGPAVQYDTSQAASADSKILIPLVLIVVLLIISILVRALVASILLVATTALSFAASFGLATLLWHALGYPGIEAQLPLYVFVFLVALGVDYNIFLIGRIREEARDTDIRTATLRGLSVTGGVITAAGVVLAATFAALSRLPYVPVAQVGTAIAVGVLLDTLLVRTVLVPAGLLMLGDRSWWPSRPAHRVGEAGHGGDARARKVAGAGSEAPAGG
ncbi:MMPL family transporter [Catenulispora pinisilvae]|uniref:MMPL family transporter n=1 Tax=Catenulispora pinisilvae TaxID=2705253 RepID=UPI0018912262|nr:MMPL family transporter [Catenulispora pinisilvae]